MSVAGQIRLYQAYPHYQWGIRCNDYLRTRRTRLDTNRTDTEKLAGYLRFLEQYVNMAGVQVLRIHDPMLTRRQALDEAQWLRASMFFMDFHLLMLCAHKAVKLIDCTNAIIGCPVARGLRDSHGGLITSYTRARNHLEHQDERIDRDPNFERTMGSSVNKTVRFEDCTIRISPDCIDWLYHIYDAIIAAVLTKYVPDEDHVDVSQLYTLIEIDRSR